jgi:hypothetical protein
MRLFASGLAACAAGGLAESVMSSATEVRRVRDLRRQLRDDPILAVAEVSKILAHPAATARFVV